MTRAKRWTVGVLAAIALLLLVAGGLVAWWLPNETEIAERVQTAFEKRFGVALKVGRVQWALRPVPVIVARRQRPHAMQMVGQHHDGVDAERPCLLRHPERQP